MCEETFRNVAQKVETAYVCEASIRLFEIARMIFSLYFTRRIYSKDLLGMVTALIWIYNLTDAYASGYVAGMMTMNISHRIVDKQLGHENRLPP